MINKELAKISRPQNWSDVIGQDGVVKSLQAAVRTEEYPTAFLFSGPPGTGKTTTALLLAKAANCSNLQKNQEPCNECDVCVAINSGTQFGVNYISAANINGVDAIREIVAEARLSQPLKRQIWIIDEVHTLSKQAFDAMLIPIEDPTMQATFIFCTTELNKVPQTIRSRAQMRTLNLVSNEVLTEHLKKLSEQYNLEVTDIMIKEAVKQSKGGVRKALSALDAMLADSGGMLAGSDESFGDRLLKGLANQEISTVLVAIAESVIAGIDTKDLAEQLFTDLRGLLLLASGVRDKDILGVLPTDNPREIAKSLYGRAGITKFMTIVGKAISNSYGGSDPRIHLELACVEIIQALQAKSKSAA